MKEELVEKANEALNIIISDAVTIREFVIAEAPDVIQQLLQWNFITNLIYFGISMLILVGIMIMVKFHYKKAKNYWNENENRIQEDNFIGFNILILIFYILPIIPFVICFNLTWLKILIAPKLYLLEYAANLI
jgi:hypothetical protein